MPPAEAASSSPASTCKPPDVAIGVARGFIAKAEPAYVPEIDRVLGEVPKLSATQQGFGVVSAALPIAAAAGKRVRYQGWIRTSGVNSGYAGLWLRVDRGTSVFFLDNMSARGASGTSDWTRYEINVNVPADATAIVFGALHPGSGTAWFDSLSLDIDGTPYTDDPRIDFGFESATPRGFATSGAGFSIGIDSAVAHSGSQSLRSRYINTPTMTLAEAIPQCAAVVDHMGAQRAAYLAAGFTAAETDWAIRNARVVCQAAELRADPTGRDRAMAENVTWILDQNPDAKIVLWAHNGHVATGSYRGYVPMGSYLWEKYSTAMVTIGFAFNQGGFQAIDGQGRGLIPFNVPPAPAGTLDNLYASPGLPIYAVDLRKAPLTGPGSLLRSRLLTRTIGSLYDERIPLLYFSEVQVPDAFDAMIFVDTTTRAQPVR
ncbi:MAG: erythromycin esterase family protein [Bryobacterales bacterium]|nr:erythromycin esterase family protein [Bryobacterales bacterium]